MAMLGEKVGHASCAVRLQAIPDQHHRRRELAVELTKKVDHTLGIDIGIAVQAKIQMHLVTLWRHAQGPDGSDFLMRSRALKENRRVSARCPTAAHQRRHQQPRFVDEYQPGPQARSVFFTRGQSTLTQVAIDSSSRSTALRVGFCGLQPIARNNRPMWST